MNTTTELLYSDDKIIIGTAKKVYNAVKENFLIACIESDELDALQPLSDTLKKIKHHYLDNDFEDNIILLKESIMDLGYTITDTEDQIKEVLFDLIKDQKLVFVES